MSALATHYSCMPFTQWDYSLLKDSIQCTFNCQDNPLSVTTALHEALGHILKTNSIQWCFKVWLLGRNYFYSVSSFNIFIKHLIIIEEIQQPTFIVTVMLLRCSFIGWPSALNSSSRNGPMLVTVEANTSAWQSCTLISRKPTDSARAECRAAAGPISARMRKIGEALLPCLYGFGADPSGAAATEEKSHL